jgi:outer membrane protein TolC
MAGLLLATAAARPTHAQTFDAVAGERVAGVAWQATPAGRPARRFDLTLDDAVQRALERNLDIAVQRIHPLVQDMRIAAANAAFLPFASSGLIFDQTTAPNRFVFDGGGLGGQPIVSDRGTYDLGVGQQVKWGGGRYDVQRRRESDHAFTARRVHLTSPTRLLADVAGARRRAGTGNPPRIPDGRRNA